MGSDQTVVAPAGWETRLIRLELPPVRPRSRAAVAWCLEVHDLVLAKLAAGRPHDVEFARDAIGAGLVDPQQLRVGLELMPENQRDLTKQRLNEAMAGFRARI